MAGKEWAGRVWGGKEVYRGRMGHPQQQKVLPIPLCWALHPSRAEMLTEISSKWRLLPPLLTFPKE